MIGFMYTKSSVEIDVSVKGRSVFSMLGSWTFILAAPAEISS